MQNLLGFCYLVQIIIMIFKSAIGKNFVVDSVRKLDIPINARVSVFGHVIYPVLNNTTMSFMCKWTAVDNLSLTKLFYLLCLL
jgi:hypothetical protein